MKPQIERHVLRGNMLAEAQFACFAAGGPVHVRYRAIDVTSYDKTARDGEATVARAHPTKQLTAARETHAVPERQ